MLNQESQKLKAIIQGKKTERKILNAGGSTSLGRPTFFNDKIKIKLNNIFRIEHLFDDYRDFPEKKTIEAFMETNLSKKEYENSTKIASDYQKLSRSAGIDHNKDSSIDQISNKFLMKTK